MERVLDVYKEPYDPLRPVVCMDESPRQLIKETRLPLKRKPGSDEKADYEYERCGVANIFMVNEASLNEYPVDDADDKLVCVFLVNIRRVPD
jgi:hypothetical protein